MRSFPLRPGLDQGQRSRLLRGPITVLDTLWCHNDHYLHLADRKSFGEVRAKPGGLYHHPENWSRKVVLNIAASRRFSSDRTIAEYAKEIWRARCAAAIRQKSR